MESIITQTGLTLYQVESEFRMDSRLISKKLGIEHKHFLETVRTYQAEIEELGVLPFQTAKPSKGSTGGRPETYALLNEDQIIFTTTLSRNTKQVVAFKLLLTKAFSEVRTILSSLPQQEQKKERIFTQDVRRRCIENEKIIPDGYWCVVTEMWREAWSLESFMKELQPSRLPDGSCGRKWRDYLRSIGSPLVDTPKLHPLHTPYQRGLVGINIYPMELLPEFRCWLRREYAEYYDTQYAPSRVIDAPMKQVRGGKKKGELPPGGEK